MSSLIPMAIGMGQQDAQNPGISFGGGREHSLLDVLDPLGNQITKMGGDPLNLYGNKNNPNALFFPSQNPNTQNGGAPAVLPTLPGIGVPQTYDPGSFGGYANLGAGPYNQMASQMAGPAYNPTLMQLTASPGKGMTPQASGKGTSAVYAPVSYGIRASMLPRSGSTSMRAK